MTEPKPTVSFEEFAKLDLRIAKVVQVQDHPNADKLICMTIDLGGQQRQIIAGLKGHYAPEELLGRQIVVVTNLQPRKVRGLESHGMLLAAVFGEKDSQRVVILAPDKDVPAGAEVA